MVSALAAGADSVAAQLSKQLFQPMGHSPCLAGRGQICVDFMFKRSKGIRIARISQPENCHVSVIFPNCAVCRLASLKFKGLHVEPDGTNVTRCIEEREAMFPACRDVQLTHKGES